MRGGGVEGHLELFRKFIRLGNGTLPLEGQFVHSWTGTIWAMPKRRFFFREAFHKTLVTTRGTAVLKEKFPFSYKVLCSNVEQPHEISLLIWLTRFKENNLFSLNQTCVDLYKFFQSLLNFLVLPFQHHVLRHCLV